MDTYYRPVPDGAAPITIWHGEIETEDEQYWLTEATHDVKKIHPDTITHLHDGVVTTLALLPPVAPGTVEAAVKAAARWCAGWRVTPTWRPEPGHVRIQEIARQEREAELLNEAVEIAKGWRYVRITSPARPSWDDQKAAVAFTEVRARIYSTARRTGLMRRISNTDTNSIVVFGHHERPVDDAVAAFIAEVTTFLPAGWTLDHEGR
ncbi:hypothetical protein [Nonomuraea candida]|uniref:hypothetical protein n=1 Tax=Nonomuraea candida TaxID=359159 RepID=UPI0005B88994|nr:hypothetical protein [Nonomuraea candida]